MGLPTCVKCLLRSMIGDDKFLEIPNVGCGPFSFPLPCHSPPPRRRPGPRGPPPPPPPWWPARCAATSTASSAPWKKDISSFVWYLRLDLLKVCHVFGGGSLQSIKFCVIFTESAIWADSVYKSRCPSVCVSVCLYVPSCEVPLKCLFAPIYKGPR